MQIDRLTTIEIDATDLDFIKFIVRNKNGVKVFSGNTFSGNRVHAVHYWVNEYGVEDFDNFHALYGEIPGQVSEESLRKYLISTIGASEDCQVYLGLRQGSLGDHYDLGDFE